MATYKYGDYESVSGYGFKFRSYIAYSISSTSTTYSVTITAGIQQSLSGDVGFNNLTVSVSGTGQTTKSTTKNYRSSNADSSNRVKYISSFTWTWNKSTSSANKTITFKAYGWGNTSTGTLSVTVPALASYTISYNGNGYTGGTAVSSHTKYYGVSLSVKSNTWTKTGYSFSKWNTKADGTGSKDYNAGASYTSNAAATMYAQWTANTYTVTLNANSGTSGSTTSVTRTYGTSFTIPANGIPSRTNYKFLGWSTSSSATTPTYVHTGGTSGTCTISSYNSTTGNITLYAVWEIAYIKPVISNLTAYRTNSATSAQEFNEGQYIYISFDYVRGMLNGSYRTTGCKIYIDNTTTPVNGSSGETLDSSGTYPLQTVAYGGSYSASTTHLVTVVLFDASNSSYPTTTATFTVPTAVYAIDLKSDNNGVSMGIMTPAISGQKLTLEGFNATGDINIASGKHFKINGANLSASDVGTLSEQQIMNLLEATIVSNNGSTVTLTNNTTANLTTVILNKGTWLCTGTATYAANSTGRRGLYFSATSGTTAGDGRYAQIECGNAGANEVHLQITQIRTITEDNTTLYLNARQNSGGNLNATYPGIQCVRIGA